MKKARKITLILAIALMVIGAGICVITFAASGFNPEAFAIGGESEEKNADISGEGVKTLIISDRFFEYDVADIEIVTSPDNDIHISYATRFESEVITETDGETMTVYTNNNKKDWRQYISFFPVTINDYPVTIAVPATVESFSIDADAADINCENMVFAKDFIFQSDACELTMANCTVNGKLHIDVDAGLINIDQVKAGSVVTDLDAAEMNLNDVSADIFDLNTDYGDIRFDNLSVGQSLKIDADASNINGSINGKASDFTVRADVDLGSSNLNNSTGGSKTLFVSTDSGNINITFLGDENHSTAIVIDGGTDEIDDFDDINNVEDIDDAEVYDDIDNIDNIGGKYDID